MLVFLGALLWSLNAPIVKLLPFNGILVCGVRSLIATVVLLPFVKPKKLQWNGWMILYMVSYAGLSFSVITALTLTDSAIAIGMQYTSIVWIWLYGVIKNRFFSWKSSTPVFLVISGVILFMLSGSGGGSVIGNIIALSEGLFFLGITVSSPRAGGENPIGLTAVANFATGIFVFLFLRPDVKPLLEGDGYSWVLLLVLGIVQVGGGYGLYNMGVRKTTTQKAAMLALWEMILGPVWVAVFLKEYPTVGVFVGFVIILIGLVLDTLWGDTKKEVKTNKNERIGKMYQ